MFAKVCGFLVWVLNYGPFKVWVRFRFGSILRIRFDFEMESILVKVHFEFRPETFGPFCLWVHFEFFPLLPSIHFRFEPIFDNRSC